MEPILCCGISNNAQEAASHRCCVLASSSSHRPHLASASTCIPQRSPSLRPRRYWPPAAITHVAPPPPPPPFPPVPLPPLCASASPTAAAPLSPSRFKTCSRRRNLPITSIKRLERLWKGPAARRPNFDKSGSCCCSVAGLPHDELRPRGPCPGAEQRLQEGGLGGEPVVCHHRPISQSFLHHM
jgi:hypothetical protein